MKSSLILVFVFVVSFLVNGCAGTVRTGANWRGAYDADRDTCDRQKSPSQEVYIACLEKKESDRQESRVRAATAPAPTAPAPTPVAPAASSQPQVNPGVVAQPPVGQPPMAMPPASVIISPESVGPYCSADPAFTLVVDNTQNRTFMVEVRASGHIKPLDCEGAKLVYVDVTRRNGRIDHVALIPPGLSVRYVFLPFNGGIGNVQVDFALVSNPGAPSIPGIEVGTMTRIYGVPRNNAEPHYQNTAAPYFRMHR